MLSSSCGLREVGCLFPFFFQVSPSLLFPQKKITFIDTDTRISHTHTHTLTGEPVRDMAYHNIIRNLLELWDQVVPIWQNLENMGR